MKGSGIKGQEFVICNLPLVICHLSLVIFPLLLLWRPLFAGEAFFWGTPLLQFVPWQRMAAEMWRSGHLPLWNPLVGCGAPLAANYQTATFYPLNLLYLLLPAEVALSWTTALHVALAGWGMYRWGRAVGLDNFPALVGALAFEGSGFLVSRVALFPSMVFAFPWLAVWLWRGEVLVRHRRLCDALWLGLALGLGLLAGHAQTAFYGGVLLTAYLVFRMLQVTGSKRQDAGGRRRGSHRSLSIGSLSIGSLSIGSLSIVSLFIVSLFIVSLVVGLGLAAVQLFPTAELMLTSQRSTGVDYDFAMTYSLWPWRLITFAAPDFFGNPDHGDYWGYPNYWEGAGYVGVLPLVLAMAVGAGGGKQGRFWVSVVVVTLVLALGKNTPLFPLLFRYVPTFDLFQAPARWLAVTTVALAALAAWGAQRWPAGHRGRRLGALGVVIGLAFLGGGLAAPRVVPGVPHTFGPATARFGATLAVAGGLMLLRRNTLSPWWRTAVVAFVLLDLLLFGRTLVPTVDRALYRGSTSGAAFLESEPGPVRVYWPTDPAHPSSEYDAEYRVKFEYLVFDDFGPRDVEYWWGMREAQLPNVGMLDGVACANNFDPLLVGRYVDLLSVAVEAPSLLRVMGVTHVLSDRPWPEGEQVLGWDAGPVRLHRLPDAPGRAWVVPTARSVPSGEVLAALTDPAFDPTVEVLLEADPSPPRSIADSPPRSIAYSLTLRDVPNGVTIHANLDAPGYLVLADTWYPGWQATVDGVSVELLRANHVFRAVALSAGAHMVEMTYRSPAVWWGAGLSLAMLVIALVGGVVYGLYRS